MALNKEKLMNIKSKVLAGIAGFLMAIISTLFTSYFFGWEPWLNGAISGLVALFVYSAVVNPIDRFFLKKGIIKL